MTDYLPIENYLPHRGAMSLLERLLHADTDEAVTQVRVPLAGLFMQDQGMPSWVGLEYMAQTVAVWAGWQAIQKNQTIKLGFLLGTRKYDAAVPFFSPRMLLQVRVHCELIGENGLGVFDCSICQPEDFQVLAAARISVYEPPDGSAYIHALGGTENSANN